MAAPGNLHMRLAVNNRIGDEIVNIHPMRHFTVLIAVMASAPTFAPRRRCAADPPPEASL